MTKLRHRFTQANLRPPVVVSIPPTPLPRPIEVTLAVQAAHSANDPRRRPYSIPAAPVVVFATALALEIRTTFARNRPPGRLCHLGAPVLVGPQPLARPIDVTLARSRCGLAKSKLPQTIVAPVTTFVARPLDVTLAASPRQARRSSSVLHVPVIINPASTVLGRGPMVSLGYSVRGRAKSRLPQVVPPVVVVTATFAGPEVHLARIRPPAVRSILRKPTVVAPILAPPLAVTLAYSLRGKAKSRLSAPTVVAPVLARPILVTLVRIKPPHTITRLGAPTDTVGIEDQGRVRVWLTYSSRGKAKSFLYPPTVVAPVLARPIVVALVRIKPPPTFSIPPAPVVVFAATPLPTLLVHLTYSRRGTPKSLLGNPGQFTPQPQADTTLLVHLAPSHRGRTMSRLRPPTRVAPVLASPIQVTLAPQRRGKAKPKLRQVIYPQRQLANLTVTLAPSSRLARRTHARLRPPTVVAPILAQPVAVTLAPQRRGRPTYFLTPPTVLNIPVVHEAIVKFARIEPPRTHSILRPPAVVFPAEFFTGPQVTLVRIRPARTHSILRPAAITVEICFGHVVCGFDFAATVCGTDVGATVTGSTTAAEVCGDDSSATATGASAPGGSVTGDDERREGC